MLKSKQDSRHYLATGFRDAPCKPSLAMLEQDKEAEQNIPSGLLHSVSATFSRRQPCALLGRRGLDSESPFKKILFKLVLILRSQILNTFNIYIERKEAI